MNALLLKTHDPHKFEVLWIKDGQICSELKQVFTDAADFEETFFENEKSQTLYVKLQKPGVIHPKLTSLAKLTNTQPSDYEIDELMLATDLSSEQRQALEWSWKEPAIEVIKEFKPDEFYSWRQDTLFVEPAPSKDDSWDAYHPDDLGLPFTEEEKKVLLEEEKKQNRKWTRAEWELFAQTWSEHCKHKIFAANIEFPEQSDLNVNSLFNTCIRKPSLAVAEKRGDCLSMFHDNAGVIRLKNKHGKDTKTAFCAKMETHNSPSAISPFGGAATGIVGVHRDILGTGLGSKPVANWDVLCFESTKHTESRPDTSLPPEVIKKGVIRGIEVGGNHSGIPTVQGSVFFDPSFAVKPFVFAGSLGVLKDTEVNKDPKPGDKLYCIGGATGIDGVRGAVMSSRSIVKDDFSGSAVQVANPFEQRVLTDFLLEAKAQGLISTISDNGAGGLASSVGEMAESTGGASIDLSNLRLKVKSIPTWVRLLSESQERMTVGTRDPKAFEELAKKMHVNWDFLGELNSSGKFEVTVDAKKLVDVELKVLHDLCPKLNLSSTWTDAKEKNELPEAKPVYEPTTDSLAKFFESENHCSREGINRRFDHEVQGRTLRKPYSGPAQKSPTQGTLIEIYEEKETYAVLSHALNPQIPSAKFMTKFSFVEAISKALCAGAQWGTLAGLDNFSWADPTNNDRSLYSLVQSNKVLQRLIEKFEIPFVSGKDSMKNNSDEFRAKETIVVSMVGSGLAPELAPSSYVQRANDIVAYIPGFNELTVENLNELKSRFSKISKSVSDGMIRSLRSVSYEGALASLVKMFMGTEWGLSSHCFQENTSIEWQKPQLGAFVLSLDPHNVEATVKEFSQLKRLGVVSNSRTIEGLVEESLDLNIIDKAYHKKSTEGFWL